MKGKILLLSIALWAGVSASVIAAGIPFRSDKLEAMGRILGESRLAALPDGENFAALNWQGLPVTVIRSGGVVEHIGYSFFLPGVRQDVGAVACNFLERYALEADLPLPREKSIEAQLEEDGVVFESGNLATLKEMCRMPEQPFFLGHQGSRLYAFGWDGGQLLFPSDAELLLGRGQVENGRRLPQELADAPNPSAPALPDAFSTRADGIMVAEGERFYSDALRSSLYYRPGNMEAVDNPALPGETLANLFAGAADAGNIVLQVKMAVYGMDSRYFSIPLRAMAGYAQQQGCTPFWGTIAQDGELIEGIVALRNDAAGYVHILRLQAPYAVLGAHEGTVQVRLTPFVPMHSVLYLFEELKK